MNNTLWILSLLFLGSCAGVHTLSDPTLVLQTRNGSELGVSTDYGVVFLGRTARSGDVEIMSWYGDGPNIESTVIEPINDQIYTAETEIRLASVPLTFIQPEPGQTVLLIGRKDRERWEKHVTVKSDPRVDGILLDVTTEFYNAPDQIGAGVFVCPEEDCARKRLVGLVAGVITLTDSDGGTKTYLSIVGPKELWRLATHRKDMLRRKPWVYRDDVL